MFTHLNQIATVVKPNARIVFLEKLTSSSLSETDAEADAEVDVEVEVEVEAGAVTETETGLPADEVADCIQEFLFGRTIRVVNRGTKQWQAGVAVNARAKWKHLTHLIGLPLWKQSQVSKT